MVCQAWAAAATSARQRWHVLQPVGIVGDLEHCDDAPEMFFAAQDLHDLHWQPTFVTALPDGSLCVSATQFNNLRVISPGLDHARCCSAHGAPPQLHAPRGCCFDVASGGDADTSAVEMLTGIDDVSSSLAHASGMKVRTCNWKARSCNWKARVVWDLQHYGNDKVPKSTI